MSGSAPFQIPQECPGQPEKQATACPGVQLSIGATHSGATYHWHQARPCTARATRPPPPTRPPNTHRPLPTTHHPPPTAHHTRHQAAWYALLVGGTRRWHFLRPRDTAHSRIPARDQNPVGKHELTCVQEVGDVVYTPSAWGHRTVNEGDIVISVSKEVPRAILRCVLRWVALGCVGLRWVASRCVALRPAQTHKPN